MMDLIRGKVRSAKVLKKLKLIKWYDQIGYEYKYGKF